jgi:hypothetical protein
MQSHDKLTKQQALDAEVFHSNSEKNADGTCRRLRRNGVTQTWKTRPEAWRVPVKVGLYQYGQIWHYHADEFHTAEDCQDGSIERR